MTSFVVRVVCGEEKKIEVIKYLFDSPRENDESKATSDTVSGCVCVREREKEMKQCGFLV